MLELAWTRPRAAGVGLVWRSSAVWTGPASSLLQTPPPSTACLLGARAAFIGVLETLDMEVEHRFEEGLGRQPPEAQGLCEGRGGSGEDETPQAACG